MLVYIQRKHINQFLIHFFLWASISVLFLFAYIFEYRRVPQGMPVRLLAIMVLFYFNYFFLVPKILLKRTTLTYVLICFLLITAVGLAINLCYPPRAPKFISSPASIPEITAAPPKLSDFPPGRFYRYRDNPFFNQIFTMLILSTPFFVSALLRVYIEWGKNEELRKKVESEKTSSELQFLKTQLNPHFLFNSLNAIYSLSAKSSKDTSEAIINLSELMRYMLYEADKDLVPLRKELEYIKNYVQLQRLRLSDSVNVKLKISGEDRNKVIPPLLFISFIENAFKYGTDYEGKTYVEINLLIENGSIYFRVENRIGTYRKQKKSSGVGLQNVKNRLNLLYPESHELEVKNDGETYCVTLNLYL
ncbi:sensor histidine kinase [Flagellimonas algicola]|nr:histidine kinase [Allomuricauda algicola]